MPVELLVDKRTDIIVYMVDNTLTKEEEQTVASYDRNATHWSETHPGTRTKEIAYFYSLLPKGKIIEIGSGSGKDTKLFLELGYEYLGTDISEGLLNEAKKRNPYASYLQKGIYELDFPTDSFDGFWAAAVLLHIPKNKIDVVLQRIHNITRNGGVGFISLKKGEGEKVVTEITTAGIHYERFFSFYQKSEFSNILQRNNFKILTSHVESKLTSITGHATDWLTFYVEVENK